MICPVCKSGEIERVTIRCSGLVLYVCEECEATWRRPERIGVDRTALFSDYVVSIYPHLEHCKVFSEFADSNKDWDREQPRCLLRAKKQRPCTTSAGLPIQSSRRDSNP